MNDPEFRYGFVLGVRLGLWCLAGIIGLIEVMVGGLRGNTTMFVGGLIAEQITIFMLMTGVWLTGLRDRR